MLRGDVAYEKVPEALEALGAVVDVVPCYAVVPETEDLTGGAAALDRGRRGLDHLRQRLGH